MESELNIIILEDGKKYAIIDEIIKNEITYVYLSNVEDENDFCIRKVTTGKEGEELIGLDNTLEFDNALSYFATKNNK